MSLENIYYVMAIICMSITLVLLIGISIFTYLLFKKITEIQKNIEAKIEQVSNMVSQPEKVAATVGSLVVQGVSKNIGKFFRKSRAKG